MSTAAAKMQRILILGSGGSGKTTFSRKLAAKTGLPLYHLDNLYWQPGWAALPKAEWQALVRTLTARDEWIMDGNYSSTVDLRVPRADAIFLLLLPPWRCLLNVLKRRVKYAFAGTSARPEMPEGCPEKVDWAFLSWIWQYPRVHLPIVWEAVHTLKNDRVEVCVFKSYREIQEFLNQPF
ncbi:MAG: AAA family ATPase [Saprospiraceae bacterium]